MSQVDLSFVIPAYDEEESIQAVLLAIDDAVKHGKQQYEIVVVNDGSNDDTFSRAKEYATKNAHVKVISYNTNMGKGHAVKTGFMQTDGDIVVVADSDLDIDLGTVDHYVNSLGRADIAIASKWHPESHVNIPLNRRILSHGFNVLVKLLTGTNIRDTQAGFKVMRKSAFINIFPKLSVKRYAFDAELLAVAKLQGLKVVELPVTLHIDSSFRSKEIAKMLVDLLGIAYRLRVTHWYGLPIGKVSPYMLQTRDEEKRKRQLLLNIGVLAEARMLTVLFGKKLFEFRKNLSHLRTRFSILFCQKIQRFLDNKLC